MSVSSQQISDHRAEVSFIIACVKFNPLMLPSVKNLATEAGVVVSFLLETEANMRQFVRGLQFTPTGFYHARTSLLVSFFAKSEQKRTINLNVRHLLQDRCNNR